MAAIFLGRLCHQANIGHRTHRGWVEGTVAWKQDNRFGIAFVDEIDPKLARGQVTGSTVPPQVRALATGADPERKFRKI